MRDYDELVKRLRSPVMWDDGEDCDACEMLQDDAADAIEELVEQRDGLLASALELMYREDLLRQFGCHNCDTQKEAEK